MNYEIPMPADIRVGESLYEYHRRCAIEAMERAKALPVWDIGKMPADLHRELDTIFRYLDSRDEEKAMMEDQLSDAHSMLSLLAEKLGVATEPHQTWNERLLEAAINRPSNDELWEQTLKDRDDYHETADQLAAEIGKHFEIDIGEHSSANCPWRNALNAIQGEYHCKHDRADPSERERLMEALLIEHSHEFEADANWDEMDWHNRVCGLLGEKLEAAPTHSREREARALLRRIVDDLPSSRDWLDPAVERAARELVGDWRRDATDAYLAMHGWVPCSPEWIRQGGDCHSTPRIDGDGVTVSHYHPAHPAEPAPAAESPTPTHERIRDIFLSSGFTIKEGMTDLKPYVYDAAYALLREFAPHALAKKQEAQATDFEAWVKSRGGSVMKRDGQYVESMTRLWWECWQEARGNA